MVTLLKILPFPLFLNILRSEGKILVVFVVIIIVLLGLFFFLWRIDRRISNLEDQFTENE